MYMSSKCFDERTRRRVRSTTATDAQNSDATQTSFQSPRIGGCEPTTAGRGELPSQRNDDAARRRRGKHQHRARGVSRRRACRALAHPDRRAAHLRRVRGAAQDAARSRGLPVAQHRRRHHLVGRAAGGVRPAAVLQAHCGGPALVVGPGIKTGMPILYENPREVGADRIVNAVAAYEELQAAAASSSISAPRRPGTSSTRRASTSAA